MLDQAYGRWTGNTERKTCRRTWSGDTRLRQHYDYNGCVQPFYTRTEHDRAAEPSDLPTLPGEHQVRAYHLCVALRLPRLNPRGEGSAFVRRLLLGYGRNGRRADRGDVVQPLHRPPYRRTQPADCAPPDSDRSAAAGHRAGHCPALAGAADRRSSTTQSALPGT